MKTLRESLGEIYREHRGLLSMMIILALMSLVFFVFSLVSLSPSSAIVKVGYGDIGSFAGDDLAEMRLAGGYRDGSWANMLTFSALALIIGIMHNMIAIRIYKRRGEGTAKAFVIISMLVLVLAVSVMMRLLNEG